MKRNSKNEIIFEDYPEFKPNLSPQEIFELGSFGGTYWRPIYSSITNKNYKNKHFKYPKSWWKNVPNEWLTKSWEEYDKNINFYKVKVGTTLEFWEEKEWITKHHPYGWVQWLRLTRTRDIQYYCILFGTVLSLAWQSHPCISLASSILLHLHLMHLLFPTSQLHP